MQWQLLNQLYVNLDYRNLGVSVLEEVVSSEAQLVQLLVSGMVSQKTMILHSHGHPCCNQIDLNKEYRL